MSDAKELRAPQSDERGLRSTVVAVALLDATPDWDRVAAVLAPGNTEASAFRHRVLEMPFGFEPRRPGGPGPDLPWHLERVAMSAPATFGDVLDFARLAPPAPGAGHPRWDLALVEGLTGGQSALVIRLHHPSEGDSGCALPGAGGGTEGSVWTWLRSLSDYGAEAIRAATGFVVGTASDMVKTVLTPAAAALHRPGGPAADGWFHAFAAPLDELREAARRAGCSVDSGFAAATLLGYAEYLRLRDSATTALQATVDTGGTATAHVELHVGADDPVGLMHRLEHSGTRPEHTGATLGSTCFDSAVARTVPGSSVPLYVGGAKIERYYGFGSALGAGFHATLMPYRGTCCIGVTATPAATPDREEFDECLRTGIQMVLHS